MVKELQATGIRSRNEAIESLLYNGSDAPDILFEPIRRSEKKVG
jgi:hypothetical protein